MGRTQCYRANVAYSLYGIRADDNRKRKENACQRRYFINSFFTNNGVDDFSDAVGLANGGDAAAECTVQNNGNENNEGENGGNNAVENGAMVNANAQSYTTYCNRNGKFVTAQFGGAYCTDKSNLQLLDSLDTLNNELDNIGCLLVYNHDWINNADDVVGEEEQEENQQEGDQQEDNEEQDRQEDEENGNGDQAGRKLEQAGNQKNGRFEGLWNLLSYSSACSTLEYPRGCPDPYGAKKRFDFNAKTSNGFWKQFMWLDWLTLAFFFIATVLLVLAFRVYKDRRKRSKNTSSTNKSARRSSRFGRSASSKSNNAPQTTQNASTDTAQVNRTTSTSSQKSKKGLFRGMFHKNNNNNISTTNES
jgi:hypothetical protein